MPSIKRNAEQDKALEDITRALETIQSLNQVLVKGWDGPIALNFASNAASGRARGRGAGPLVSVIVTSEEKEYASLLKLAQVRKTKLLKEINSKSLKYGIILSKEDRLIMGPADAAAAAAEAEEAESGRRRRRRGPESISEPETVEPVPVQEPEPAPAPSALESEMDMDQMEFQDQPEPPADDEPDPFDSMQETGGAGYPAGY